jgi:RNA polymerase sigma factor (sigma-70 family)
MFQQLNPARAGYRSSPAPNVTGNLDLSHLAREAAAGDERAWADLVGRLDGVLHTVARRYRLTAADVDDVVQTTWLRALAHLHRLNDPGAIGAWLIVTARREAMRTLQRATREILTDDPRAIDDLDPGSPEAIVIERERCAAVHGAVGRLPGRQRRLMTSMLGSPATTYAQISTRLEMPVGSIGPTRDRALARLREDPELERVMDR